MDKLYLNFCSDSAPCKPGIDDSPGSLILSDDIIPSMKRITGSLLCHKIKSTWVPVSIN